jgi:outer membrane protein assembly factor BamB
VELLRQVAPDAEGTVGGVRGRDVELLANLLDASQTWSSISQPAGWTTFGGSPARGKIARQPVDVALQPAWSVPLPRRFAGDRLSLDEHRSGEHRDALLSYYPLVVEDTVLVCSGESLDDVSAWDLRTGQARWPEVASVPEERSALPGRLLEDGLPRRVLDDLELASEIGVPRFTMTAARGRLYVKLGAQATTVPRDERGTPSPVGYLAALDLEAQKKLLFEIHPDQPPWGEGWALEGPPVADGQHLFVALRRRDNLRAQAHVACFDAKRGRLRWRKFIAGADTVGQGRLVEYTHNLLTLDQGVLYYNTNLGAVAALRAEDGQIQWITRYPRMPASAPQPGRSLRHLLRDLTPCLVSQGIVFVAPADCDRLFALDAATGTLRWTTEEQTASDLVHLLGVGQGQLLASGSRLWWLDVETGAVTARFPGRVEDDLRAYGRGVLAGNEVYWPTRDRIYVFAQTGSQPTRQPIDLAPLGLTGGNLVISDGVLLIAAANRLVAFTTREE